MKKANVIQDHKTRLGLRSKYCLQPRTGILKFSKNLMFHRFQLDTWPYRRNMPISGAAYRYEPV